MHIGTPFCDTPMQPQNKMSFNLSELSHPRVELNNAGNYSISIKVCVNYLERIHFICIHLKPNTI